MLGIPIEFLVAVVAVVAIALYAIFGGADFGGGVWDVLASGPRRAQQQEIIGHAIGPVWETNHVWLIFMIVLLFTCFPPAFASLSIGLYVPLTFVLVGIILRGAAYAFRSQANRDARLSQVWGHVFGIASIVSPFFFGTCVGGLTIGHFAWTSPFAFAVGTLAVAMCAQLAAVFLTCEVRGPVRQDFRTRGMAITVVLAALGAATLAVAAATAPAVFAALTKPQSIPGIATAMVLGFVVIGCLWFRRYNLARIAVCAETIAILIGWYASQAPFLIPGELTYVQAAAPRETLRAFLVLVAGGSALLVPSLWLLFRVFKSEPLEHPT
ncbi:MAG: cytochrome d ubiquinol oxidase subunit II [Candidatus Eremiobacteraeota bacterium]|nr:cytochrome d ubiquinol oxidase subunit II [Candidatus Eremiobacteraeota bacterium]